jgi:hypothetical protein
LNAGGAHSATSPEGRKAGLKLDAGFKPGPSRGEEPDTYYSITGPSPIAVSKRQVGILVRHDASPRELRALADSMGLRTQRRLGEFLFAYDLPDTLPRRELVKLTRELKSRGGRLVAEAGMLAAPPGIARKMLVTDKFIAQFRRGASTMQVDSLNAANGVRILEANRLLADHYLLEVTGKSRLDALAMSSRYHRSGLTAYAHPNWVHNLRFREYLPSDGRFSRQWHHHNTGQGLPCTESGACPEGLPCEGEGIDCPGTAGTEDADIDTPKAWEILHRLPTSPGVTIAVIDGGYDLEHDDLKDVLWTATDGSHGYDFFDCDGCRGRSSCETCGDTNPTWESDPTKTYMDHDAHGTPVAGLVAAPDNGVGVVGVYPGARLMLIRRGFDEEHLAQAFRFAHGNGARVITCSWGFYSKDPRTPTLHNTISEVVHPPDGSAGSTVLFAMDYAGSASCERDDGEDLADLSDVIAVGGSTNLDTRLPSAACGDYVDVLAPSGSGSLNIATTDVRDVDGYNDRASFVVSGECPAESESADSRDYTYCFGGTSAAAPIAAGLAGMLLAASPTLAPDDVRRLLQDTADKVEPSAAAYDPATGFSDPPATPSTHGYGRVNAFEAIRVVAPVDAGGKGGVDVFLRDNRLDWGNTERRSSVTFEQTRGYEPHWDCMDLKVDAGPGYQADPTLQVAASEAFDALTDEEPAKAAENRVYVRVRNRGPGGAADVTVRLYWAYMGTAAPPLSEEFWAGFAANDPIPAGWTFIGQQTLSGDLPNSGCTAAKEARDSEATDAAEDGAKVLGPFLWTPPADDSTKPSHFCLLAIADSPTDHPGPYAKVLAGEPLVECDTVTDELAATDNNVSLRSLGYEDSSIPSSSNPAYSRVRVRFFMRNPSSSIPWVYHDVSYPYVVIWDHADGYPGPVRPLSPGEEIPVHLDVGVTVGTTGELKAYQYVYRPHDDPPTLDGPRGGFTIRLRPGG